MNNLAENSNNIISFPNSLKSDEIPDKTIKNIEHIKWGIDYHKNKGLNLFKANDSLADTKLLVDNQGEILRIDTDTFILDGHSNIWKLLSYPSNSEELIRAREDILNTINNMSIWLRDKLYKSKEKILKLNWFREKFDHFEDLEWIIKDLEESIKSDKDSDNSNILSKLIFSFGWASSGEFEEVRQLIPGHLQLIRNIWWDFFNNIANELSKLFKKANNFSLTDLKRIYEEKDYDAFSKLTSDVEAFCNAYSDWDWILIAAYWAKNGYIETVKTINNESECALWVKDPRGLLNNDKDKFHSHIPNNLPNQNNIELYSWWNGSWKSTWLKTRLMLQLFYQTYGKVAAKDAELIIRNQIIFINRWWSGYWEDLSAFWNDIKRKLMSFIPSLQNWALIFLDEFGSTIPEEEAYCLIRALLDYLDQFDAKVYIANHNEKYINWVAKNKKNWTSLYNFKSKETKDWTMKFSYKLKEWKDSAHTLKVFKAAWMPNDIVRRASKWMLGSLGKSKVVEALPYKDIVSYSQEEREILKQENKWFAWFSRHNDMVKGYYWKDKKHYDIVRKYKPLWYENRPNPYYDSEDLFFSASHPDNLDQEAPEINFDFMRYWTISYSDDPMSKAQHLESKGINKKHIYTSSNWTLSSLTTWWLTSDVKELQERQKFFEEIWDWSYEDASKTYRSVNTFKWVFRNFQDGWGWSRSLDFDYNELSKFNKAYWWDFIDNIDKYIAWYWFWRVCEWFLILIDMEWQLNNLPEWFRESHKEFLVKLQETVDLTKRYNKAKERTNKRWKDEFKTSAKLAEKLCKRIEETIDDLWWIEVKSVIDEMTVLHTEIDMFSSPVDILELDKEKRNSIIWFLDDSKIFQNSDSDYWESISNWFHGMTQIIRALKWTWNLLSPLLEKLRSFDSVHAHQIANYLEDFIDLPDVEDFVKLVKMKRDNPEKYNSRDKYFRFNSEHSWAALFELLWLIDIANQIKKLWWTKVQYNSTWEIDIKWMTHPWVEKTQRDQTDNDLYLWAEKAFDLLEWATMWWKTFNIQSMQWIVRLSNSIWYVPASYATLPCFDGLVYIDRILENEKKWLSAGQNDAKTWSEIILKIRKLIKEKSEKWRYWFSIDEMISSVPARFQKWLVGSLLEELRLSWQKWQISIHNPKLVSQLIEEQPKSYNVRHPEVEFDEKWIFDYTYKIKDWRSVDKNGDFTAYSLETAEKMWLPKEIIERARKYKNWTI